jgi:hypothetical protein
MKTLLKYVSIKVEKNMPRLRRLVAGLSPRTHGFAPWSIYEYVGFVVHRVALGDFFSEFSDISLSIPFHRDSTHIYIIGG